MRLPVFRKEIRSIIRERTFISTILLQFFLIAFYWLAIIGIFVVMNPNNNFGQIQALVSDNEFVDDGFLSLMDNFNVTRGDLRFAQSFDVAIEFTSSDPAIIYVYTKGQNFRSTYIIAEFKKVMRAYQEDHQSSKAKIVTVNQLLASSGQNIDRVTLNSLIFEFKYLLMFPLLMFLPIYLSGVLFIDIFTEEHAKKTMTLLKVAPISMRSIVYQKILAALVLSTLQIIAWITLLTLRNIDVENKLPVILILVLTNILVLFISALIASVSRTRTTSQLIFSLFVIMLLVTKGFRFNPLNMVTKLAIIDVSFVSIIFSVIGLVAAIIICASLVELKLRS